MESYVPFHYCSRILRATDAARDDKRQASEGNPTRAVQRVVTIACVPTDVFVLDVPGSVFMFCFPLNHGRFVLQSVVMCCDTVVIIVEVVTVSISKRFLFSNCLLFLW